MASLSQWTWVWAKSESWWKGSRTRCNPWGHRVGHKSATEQQHRQASVLHVHSWITCYGESYTVRILRESMERPTQRAAESSGCQLARNRPASSHASELGNNSSSPGQAWGACSLTVDSYERPQARPAESLLGSWPSESVWENGCCFKVLRLEVICHIGLEN